MNKRFIILQGWTKKEWNIKHRANTWPRLAAAIGWSSNSLNNNSIEAPSSLSIKSLAFFDEKAGTLSWDVHKIISQHAYCEGQNYIYARESTSRSRWMQENRAHNKGIPATWQAHPQTLLETDLTLLRITAQIW